MLTDLLGDPIQAPVPAIPAVQARPRRKDPEALRRKALRDELANPTLLLFEEVLEFLRRPILSMSDIPKEYRTADDYVVAAEGEVEEVNDPSIAYQPWGSEWVGDKNGFGWSAEGIHALQIQLFWESMKEMARSNNEHDKWSVLKWVFRPAYYKEYVWDKKLGHSRSFMTHERDLVFSFHNCAMAARLDKDLIRAGFERNLPPELIQQVLRVTEA